MSAPYWRDGVWFRGEKYKDLNYRRRQNGEEGTYLNDIQELELTGFLEVGRRWDEERNEDCPHLGVFP